jgi:lipopolysaccharide transport system ATP-binding protein
MTIAISVKNLSKRYQIGAAETKFRYNMLRDVLVDTVYAPVRLAKALVGKSDRRTNQNFVWALKDICFDLEEGKVLGIVGRNGAGKSTLLKILSRVTEPTEGTVTVRGRVGSLLEVGTGFHPELTGRENIYMNGAILGMKHSEIDKKFDEMVEFSEVGQFIDTPVKRYSSGMYLRLAFAVAAHLEPEILVVDEVLASATLNSAQVSRQDERCRRRADQLLSVATCPRFCGTQKPCAQRTAASSAPTQPWFYLARADRMGGALGCG